MDPDATLAEIRSILDSTQPDYLRLMDLMHAMDEWLSKGSHLPAAWKENR